MQGPVGAGGSWKCKGVQRKRQRKNRRCPTIGEGIEKGRTRVTPCNEGWPLGPGQMLPLINPVEGAEPLDHAGWPFEAQFDGFRACGRHGQRPAHVTRRRLARRASSRASCASCFPKGHVFDGR
jgi:hypothetical protein